MLTVGIKNEDLNLPAKPLNKEEIPLTSVPVGLYFRFPFDVLRVEGLIDNPPVYPHPACPRGPSRPHIQRRRKHVTASGPEAVPFSVTNVHDPQTLDQQRQ
jgi:hypothetical protein